MCGESGLFLRLCIHLHLPISMVAVNCREQLAVTPKRSQAIINIRKGKCIMFSNSVESPVVDAESQSSI